MTEQSPTASTEDDLGVIPDKRPRTVLAGPYGHPFHPVLVTVPIGAWVCAVVFDVVARSGGDAAFARGAFWLVVIGLVGAVVAALFGVMDLMTVPARTKAGSTAVAHAVFNTVALLCFGMSALVRREDLDTVALAPFLWALGGLVVVGLSGWLGGKLSYTYGVRVAREDRQREGYR